MATYKLLQDIEAEDHIVGPLTLRQFIFGLIAMFFLYINFLVVAKVHAYFLLVITLPPFIFFGFFAIPFGRDQPTEVWFLAKLRFWFKPRKRIWNQSGVKELVKINVPKKIEKNLTNGLSNYEVNSRLKTLANTLDSRGWAVKNISSPNSTVYAEPTGSDRLVDLDTLPEPVQTVPDILDPNESTVAQHFNAMIQESDNVHRQQLVEEMNSDPKIETTTSSNQWFMPHIDQTKGQVYATDVPAQVESEEEKELAEKLKNTKANEEQYYGHIRVLPTSEQKMQNTTQNTSNKTVSPDILKWADRDDVTIQTIAHQVKKPPNDKNDEVIISLH